MKKIAFLLPDLLPGGAQRVFSSLSKYLTENGYAVDLLLITNLGTPKLFAVPNVRIQYLSPGINYIPFNVAISFWRLFCYLRKTPPDILISSLTRTNIFATIVKLLSNTKIPFILREGNVLLNISSKSTLFLMRRLYPIADRIICVSKEIEGDLANALNISRDKMLTINNPIDLQRIRNMGKEPPDHKWLGDKQTPVIVAVGRLTKAKGFDVLIKAFSNVVRQIPAKLIILGQGPDLKELQQLVDTLQLKNNVDLAGIKTNPYTYISHSDLFVLSSRWEGFVNVLLEAMGLGTRVVATNCQSSPYEILLQGQIGKLVEVEDIEGLSNAILECIKNGYDTAPLVERAEDFSLEKISHQYISAIESL